MRVRIVRADDIADRVRRFRFVPDDPAEELPAYTPGSHLKIQAGPVRNAYSLTGDGILPDYYEIAVRRQADGHGGSVWMHECARLGDVFDIEPPTSGFAPAPNASKHLLLAAGIGVTAILSHLRAARAWNKDVQVLFGHSAGRAPFHDELVELAGSNLVVAQGRAEITEAVTALLAAQPIGTHAYACGPAGFLESYQQTGERLGWVSKRQHFEFFAAPEMDAGEPFTVRIASSGMCFEVPAGVSLLEELDRRDITRPRMCGQGVCGECRTPVKRGELIHRDLLQTRDEKQANRTSMYPCVSRAKDEVELDL